MSYEPALVPILESVVGAGKAYPDAAIDDPAAPYVVYMQPGGFSVNFLDVSPTGIRNAEVQVTVWATTRKEAAEKSRAIEEALLASSLNPMVFGAFAADFDPQTRLYGAVQSFSIWWNG